LIPDGVIENFSMT